MTTINIGLNTGNTSAGWLDTEITNKFPTNNYGSGSPFGLQNDGGSNVYRALIQIPNISSILGSGSTINSVTLNIRRLNTGGSGNVSIYRLKKTPVFNQATWNLQSTGVNWGLAGALDTTDYDSSAVANGAISGTGYKTLSSTGLRDLIQGWTNLSIVNNGMIVAADSGFSTYADWGSGERTDGQRPYLTIDYTPSVPPIISVSDPVVSHLSGTATFTLTASSTFGSNITVDYATQDVTATAGVDYTAKSGTATILAGQTTTTVVVDILP